MDKLNLLAALPEIVLLLVACVVLIADVVRGRGAPVSGIDRLALIALFAPFFAVLSQTGSPTEYAFNGMYVADEFARLLKLCACVATAVTLLYARAYIAERQMYRGEFYTLALFSLLGQMVMISSNNLLVTYMGLELMSLSLYALAALRRDSGRATEAAIKYFVLGALASGFLLYGMSMLYGGTGSLDLPDIAKAIATGQANRTVMVFGVVFIVAGLAFKFGAVPFHMWVPDVYHGAPTAVTLMIGGAPKLAAFAIVIRLLVEGMGPAAFDWQGMLAVLAVVSLLVGNLAAIAQTNLKRMLAFSTIAQMGFLLLALVAGVVDGNQGNMANAYASGMFYVITYVLTTLGTFGVILLLSRNGFESEEIADLAGLNQRSPLYAGVMAICMFSLAGVPPMVGFYAKLSVLQALLAAPSAFYVGLAVFAVMMSLVGAFYYLRLVKVMYFDEPIQTAGIEAGTDVRAVLSVNGALVLLLGVVPGGLMALCAQAITQLLA